MSFCWSGCNSKGPVFVYIFIRTIVNIWHRNKTLTPASAPTVTGDGGINFGTV